MAPTKETARKSTEGKAKVVKAKEAAALKAKKATALKAKKVAALKAKKKVGASSSTSPIRDAVPRPASRPTAAAGPTAFTMDDALVPDGFCDPITMELMCDPVIIEGISFSRSSAESWLRDHDTHPSTGVRLIFLTIHQCDLSHAIVLRFP